MLDLLSAQVFDISDSTSKRPADSTRYFAKEVFPSNGTHAVAADFLIGVQHQASTVCRRFQNSDSRNYKPT